MADVLVVDDDPAIRAFLELIVRRAGFEADSARDGQEGLEMMEARRYKLVIVDLMMPRMNGYQMLERVSDFPDRPAIIVATAMEGAHVRDLDGRVVHSVVRKPFDLELMTSLITSLVRSMTPPYDPNDDTLRMRADD